jgi:hypothetical protein
MRRNPSASHWVKKPPPLVYRPDSWVFFSGAQVFRISRVKAVLVPERHALPVSQHAQQGEVFAVEAQGLSGSGRRVALDQHLAGDDGLGRLQIEVQFDGADAKGRRCVVGTLDDHGGGSITQVHSCLLGPVCGPVLAVVRSERRP